MKKKITDWKQDKDIKCLCDECLCNGCYDCGYDCGEYTGYVSEN